MSPAVLDGAASVPSCTQAACASEWRTSEWRGSEWSTGARVATVLVLLLLVGGVVNSGQPSDHPRGSPAEGRIHGDVASAPRRHFHRFESAPGRLVRRRAEGEACQTTDWMARSFTRVLTVADAMLPAPRAPNAPHAG